MLVRMWRKGNPHAQLVGMWIGAATTENSMEVSQNLKIELLYDPAILLLDIYLEKKTTTLIKNIHVHSRVIYYCQVLEMT